MAALLSAPGARLSRRVFMRSAGGMLALRLIACGDGGPTREGDGDGDGSDAGGPRADAGGDRPGDAGGADAAADAGAQDLVCLPFITPADEFPRLYGGDGTVPDWRRPELDPQTHRLSIQGLVRDPLELSLADLEADTENHVRVVNTLQCVFGTRGTAIWTGIPLRVLLERAGLQRDRVRRVRMRGADGFGNNLRMEDLYEPAAETFEPLLSFRMNGAPILGKLGGPARVLLADRYGFKNTKWVSVLEATASDEVFGQYQSVGLAEDAAVVAANARVDISWVSAGPLTLCGHGLSGTGGVESIQVSVNGRPYEDVALLSLDEVLARTPQLRDTLQYQQPEAFPWPYRGVWAPFEHPLELTRGDHHLTLRIVDRSGVVADGFNVLVTAQ